MTDNDWPVGPSREEITRELLSRSRMLADMYQAQLDSAGPAVRFLLAVLGQELILQKRATVMHQEWFVDGPASVGGAGLPYDRW